MLICVSVRVLRVFVYIHLCMCACMLSCMTAAERPWLLTSQASCAMHASMCLCMCVMVLLCVCAKIWHTFACTYIYADTGHGRPRVTRWKNQST